MSNTWLCIDPGLAIALDFEELVRSHNPDCLVLEQPFFNREITSAGKVLGAVGVMLAVWGRLRESDPVLLHQSSWKARLLHGKASKREVIQFMFKRFDLNADKLLDDTADAIALGLAAISGLRNNI